MTLRLFAATALAALGLTSCGGSGHHARSAPKVSASSASSSGVALQTAFRQAVKEVSPSVVQAAIAKQPIVSALTSVLAGLKPGQQVALTVRRPDGGEHKLQVTLGQLGG